MNFLKSLIILLGICLLSIQLHAQVMDPTKLKFLKADDLTDEQIVQIKSKLTADGTSITDFQKQAIAGGAQPAELAKVIDRINKLITLKQPEIDDSRERKSETKTESKKTVTVETNNIFGSDLFNNPNISFAPNLNMPTPKNYVLSTGDQLIIDIYGFSEANLKLKISPEGFIRIPNVGPVSLNGLTIDQAKARIAKVLVKNGYSRLQNGETSVQITLGEIRSIKVTMIGEITTPGTYTFPSLATVYTALYASGGPGKNGSFRDIQLIRDNKIIAVIDVYDYLMNGDKSKDLVLKEQDIIKVNPYKTRVTLVGQIKHPAIFEAIESDNIQSLIRYSGGFTENAYKYSLNIVRITSREKEILDVKEDQFAITNPVNGDSLTVGKVLNRFSNRVTIMGSVFREGNYALFDGLTLSGLIKKADGLQEDAYLNKATLFRKSEDLTPTVQTVDLHKILKGEEDILLKKEDSLYIYSKFKTREALKVSISGAVLKQGTFSFSENMHIKDLVYMAGGLRENAGKEVEVSRLKKNANIFEKNSTRTDIIQYTLGQPNDTLTLQPFDEVFIKNDPGYMAMSNVTILGEIANPGTYTLKSNDERLSSLIKRSGGLTADAYPLGATLFRSQKLDTIPGNVGINLLEAVGNPGSNRDIILVKGDVISIPREVQTISIAGQVYNPSQIIYKNGKSLRYYLSRAGGLDEKALKSGIYVTAPNGEVSATRKFLAFRFYPKVYPGSNITVPEKEKKEQMTEAAKMGMIVTIGSTIATIAILLYQATK